MSTKPTIPTPIPIVAPVDRPPDWDKKSAGGGSADEVSASPVGKSVAVVGVIDPDVLDANGSYENVTTEVALNTLSSPTSTDENELSLTQISPIPLKSHRCPREGSVMFESIVTKSSVVFFFRCHAVPFAAFVR